MSKRYPGGVISAVKKTATSESGVWDSRDQMNEQAAGRWPAKFNVDDVFSAYTYTGNGSTQTITNGIDLAGKGGMVWCKQRSSTQGHVLFDSLRGSSVYLSSNVTDANITGTSFAFNSNGFGITGTAGNLSSGSYSSWTFRKAPKFFDVVTYTGNATNRTIAHNLGVAPGMIIIKRTDAADNWIVYHRSLANTDILCLESTAAKQTSALVWNSTTPTASVFSLGNVNASNISGGSFVAYLFAHDTGTDGLIQCGSFTTDGSGNATVSLGWEPQFQIIKKSSAAGPWFMLDSMRGNPAYISGVSNVARLQAESSGAETADYAKGHPTATGFQMFGQTASETYIYLAIRRPNKPPTTGTQVYNAIARTGTGAAATVTGVGFAPDFVHAGYRVSGEYKTIFDRLRGANRPIEINTPAELTSTDTLMSWGMDGFSVGGDGTYASINQSGAGYINHFFRRAPGVFDAVCYTGNGTYITVPHNLGVAPELMIIKARTDTSSPSNMFWSVWCDKFSDKASLLKLNGTDAIVSVGNEWWNSNITTRVYPTATTLYFGTAWPINGNTDKYVAYLFATKAGISKVGSYTGNGGTLQVDCQFGASARFILIKRTDSTGDWFTYDSTRGYSTSADPHLSLNTTAAEVATTNDVDLFQNGFTVVQNVTTNLNVTSATYIYLAMA